MPYFTMTYHLYHSVTDVTGSVTVFQSGISGATSNDALKRFTDTC